MNVTDVSEVSLRLMASRSVTQGLVPSSGEYPVLMVKHSLVWPIPERRLTILATARTEVSE